MIKKVKPKIKRPIDLKAKKQKTPIELSIIIVSFNTEDLTKQTIESTLEILKKDEISGEVIVVDNDSRDGSLKMLRDYKEKIILLENKRNLGFGTANDRGAHHARGEYLLFLNSDTLVQPGAFKESLKIFEENPDIGIVSPILVNRAEDSEPQRGSFGKFFTPFKLILRLTRQMPKLNLKNNFTYVDWVTGAALMIRKELFSRLRGFDENIFFYFEDQDLCKRVKDLDLDIDIAVVHNAKIVHLGGQSIKKNKRNTLYDKSQNYFIAKHYGLLWAAIIHLLRAPYRLMQKSKITPLR